MARVWLLSNNSILVFGRQRWSFRSPWTLRRLPLLAQPHKVPKNFAFESNGPPGPPTGYLDAPTPTRSYTQGCKKLRRLQNRLYEPALNLISQRLSGFECVGDSLLRFALSAQADESFALQIENILLGNHLRRGDPAARENIRQFPADNRVMLARKFSPNQHVNRELSPREKFFAQ